MNRIEKQHRFEELAAGRAMGDLSPDEAREFVLLAAELGTAPDPALEMLAASLDAGFLTDSAPELSASLQARLEKHAAGLMAASAGKILTPDVPAWRRVFGNPLTGWAAAAVVALAAWFGTRSDSPLDPAFAEAKLRAEARDLIERPFQGVGTFGAATGKVVWSDQQQKGYMTLSGIPSNDPKHAQYQLWIVDPKRDEAPVDGGVFDIPADGSGVVIPIVAKLALSQPQAFVITLEQPGGVVKSKQEHVVALAKN